MWTSTIVGTFNLVEEDKLIKEDVPRPFCGVTHIKVNMDLFSNCIISCDNSMDGYVNTLLIYINLMGVVPQWLLECYALKTWLKETKNLEST